MTREEAERRGWYPGKRQGDEVVEYWAIFREDEKFVDYRIRGQESLSLAAITAVERYPDALRLLEEARAEVEILRQRVRTLESALRPFVEEWRHLEYQYRKHERSTILSWLIRIGDLRAAAEAMGEGDDAS